MSEDFARRVTGVASLAEEVRRALSRYVVAEPEPVSRDRASAGVGVPRHTAKFHLDRLVDEGLLETEYRRPEGRRGPGAGRPSKLYRPSPRELRGGLPERRYDLAGELMATAIDDSVHGGTGVLDTLTEAAARRGAEIGSAARNRLGRRPTRAQRVAVACEVLG